MANHYDIIIIGAGAGGGTLAYALASTGKRILMLERGGYLPKEKANWDPTAILLEQRYQTQETWLDQQEQEPFKPEAYYNVGGNTKAYGAALQRLRAEDFEPLQHYDGVSPAWPLSYDEYEPYYTQAERLYTIHGQKGEDPTEPPMSADYPFKPFPHAPRIQTIADQLRDRGLHPHHLTLALNRDVDHPENRPCIRCDTCDPYPCLADAKSDAQIACVNPALKNSNVSLLTHAKVTRLHTDSSGHRIQTVEADVEGELQQFSADIVVVSCGAVNSAVLLLQSANDQHPEGLANSSGLVGRNLMLHNHSAVIAVSDQPNPTTFQKTLGINDFYFRGIDQDYPLGQIQLTGKAKWQRLRHMFPGDFPQAMLEYAADHSVDWWVTTEDLPRPENRVTVDQQGKISVSYTPNNLKPHWELVGLLENYLRELGFFMFWQKKVGMPVVWHQAGTCLFGDDPNSSVLNLDCRTHDIENLYVVDGSFLPTLGAVNPTLTIAANALRVADHLRHQLA
jgi:choline dehydrogenase-like flavoprotein